ncbi:Uncharacterized protein ALO42_05453 [Pseudomonas syringae pv. atrofaciens]|nr:Uncharacterized protein ALO42_05453 [Pseudomonas syringae pv. atrofaciens]
MPRSITATPPGTGLSSARVMKLSAWAGRQSSRANSGAIKRSIRQSVQKGEGHGCEVIVFDAHVQFAFAEPGGKPLARLRLCSVADRVAALVEQDAVTASQCGERADHVEGLHLTLQLQLARLDLFANGSRQTLGQGIQTLAQKGQGPAWMLGSKAALHVRQTQLTLMHVLFKGAAQAHVQVVQPLRLLTQALARMTQTPRNTLKTQPLAHQAVLHAADQSPVQVVDASMQVAGIRGEQFGGSGGRRCTHVGDKVADGHIGFMPDSADNRRHARVDGAGDGFFVEAPQVLQRAAATCQDQSIEAPAVGQLQCADNLVDRLAALNGCGNQGQLDPRRATAEHADDVADHRTGWRTDNPDTLRVQRQRDLALGAEQAFIAELGFQRIERQAQCTITGRFHRIENQLIVATTFKQRNLAAHLDLQAVLERLTHPRCALPEQRAAYLRARVLQREVHMARGRAREVGDLALDPDAAEHVFQQHAGAAVELADSKDFPVEAESCERVFDHVGHHNGNAGLAHRSVSSVKAGLLLDLNGQPIKLRPRTALSDAPL